ncbi:MAG: TadE/TadG family type IV pilus assembly protein [Bryobacteraceae bacterium]
MKINLARRGASLVEFGLAAMVFFMLLFGIMDWAWVFHQHQTIASRTSMAARWAAAHYWDEAAVHNLVNCGTLTCSGTTSYYADAAISVSLKTASDVVDDLTTLTRRYVEVRVSNYKIRHFIPGFSGIYAARDIVALQPMECLDPGGDCTCPGPSCQFE